MTTADRIKALLDAGKDVAMVSMKGDLHRIDITASYIRVTFIDGSKLQRVWNQGVVWVVVP